MKRWRDVDGQYREREMGHAKALTGIDEEPDGIASDSPAQQPLRQLSQPASIDRRRFLKITGIAAATASVAPASALAMLTAPERPRHLKFYNLHTSEKLDIVYYEKGRYIPQALAEIDYILRDYRQNVVKPMSPALLDLVTAIRHQLRTDAEVEIISGYRTAQTNAMLAAHSDGVAHHSLHMDGLALDWRVPGRTLDQLHRVALAMRGGGVGYYPSSDFVHTDVGRVRYW